jgi:hypothetical protein
VVGRRVDGFDLVEKSGRNIDLLTISDNNASLKGLSAYLKIQRSVLFGFLADEFRYAVWEHLLTVLTWCSLIP